MANLTGQKTSVNQWLQTAAVIIGFAGLIWKAGGKDADLHQTTEAVSGLTGAVQKLAEATGNISTDVAVQKARIEEVQRRLGAVETALWAPRSAK